MSLAVPSRDYARFLAALKERIRQARGRAARAVNYELIDLYWDIGKAITEKRAEAGWGDAVVERLSRDLNRAFPDVRGFSAQNLWRMQQFYLTHTAPEFLSQAVRELGIKRRGERLSQAVRELLAAVPWGHHANALAKVSDPSARLYYLRAAAHLGWTRDVLLNQIKAEAYERAIKEKKSHNFTLALPGNLAVQADEILRSRYNLEFLGVAQAFRERELEHRLVDALQSFILELGYGFCFVGRQHRLTLGRKEYFVDLLFYHRFLRTLVAFDLKLGPFEPEHAGKLRGRLPSARQLAAVVREALPARD
jgi:predicted nuclease of restriction endonuclease-like (RecB) superfamily